MKTLKRVVLWLQVALAVCTLTAYLAPYIHPGSFSLPGMLSLFFPHMVLGHLLFMIFWLVVREYYLLISLAVMVLGWNHVQAYFQLGGGRQAESDHVISIATYNSYQFNKVKGTSTSIAEALRTSVDAIGKPEILCLQESAGAHQLNREVGYPHVQKIKGSFSMLYSKHPIIRYEKLDLDPYIELSASFDIALDHDTIRVFLLHLASNRITHDTERLLDDPDLQNRSTWLGFMSLLDKYGEAAAARGAQADSIAQYIAQSPYPVLVCGDFNDVALSYAYHVVKGNLYDSFVECGKGMSTTYAGKIKGLRIDYILGSSQVRFISHEVHDLPMSDHLPVVARFELVK